MAQAMMGKRGGRESDGFETLFDRFLTGEDGRPVNVIVEKVRKTTDLIVKHNLETKGDFGPIDFFMPLGLLGIIFGLSVFSFLGLAICVQIVLAYDLVHRVRRRPSGLRVTGLVPPYRDGNWLTALLIYLGAAPFLVGAGYVNRFIVGLFHRPANLYEQYASLLYGPGMTGIFLTLGLVVLLYIFFQTVVFAPITEEIWFRGIGLAGFIQHNNSRVRSVLWTSVIFGALHGPSRILDASLFGLVAALIRFRTGSTYCCIAVHMLHNFSVTAIALYLAVASGFG